MAFKIIVCAKQVPDTNEIKINPETGTLIRDGVPSILNPDDANAVELALDIKDKYDDVHVTVVTMGPPQAQDMLFECLAMGCDEGILVSDRAVGGSDTWATSNAISAAIRKIGDFDLILAGRQAIDGDTAQVGPQIAEKMDLPQVTYVKNFAITDDMKTITVERALEDGHEVLAQFPEIFPIRVLLAQHANGSSQTAADASAGHTAAKAGVENQIVGGDVQVIHIVAGAQNAFCAAFAVVQVVVQYFVFQHDGSSKEINIEKL